MDEIFEEGFLGSKVTVDGLLADPGGRRDVVHRGQGVPTVEEHLLGTRQNRRALTLLQRAQGIGGWGVHT
jgi:hypothetical protein